MKLCFVTVGATASFQKLLEQILSSQFLETLAKRGYTHLLIQYGKDGQQIFQSFIDSGQPHHGLTLGGFDFQPSIDAQMMMTVEREALNQERGLIICHAGMNITISRIEYVRP
jgi:beta-1,4-N-acetylglucosaminyltransferase